VSGRGLPADGKKADLVARRLAVGGPPAGEEEAVAAGEEAVAEPPVKKAKPAAETVSAQSATQPRAAKPPEPAGAAAAAAPLSRLARGAAKRKAEVAVGLSRIAALYYRASTLYQMD
jgi:hypothetical protein